MQPIVLDWCRFGEAYRKRTRIYVSEDFLAPLGRTCTGGHEHVGLSGWKDLKHPDRKRQKTADATAYAPQLCEEWATLVARRFRAA